MPIGLIAGAIAGGGSLLGGLFGANAAGNAASAQAQAAQQAAQLQYQESQNALNFEQNVFNTGQQNLAPFLQTGQSADATLAQMMGLPIPNTGGTAAGANTNPGFGITPINQAYGSQLGLTPQQMARINQYNGVQPQNTNSAMGGTNLLQPFTQQFNAPTLQQAENYPGYQFQLQQGEEAIQRSAAAQGNLLTGGTQKDLINYAQGAAQSDYNNVYNQALQQYQQSYNIFENNQANAYNRLASLAGLGQTTAAQLGGQGLQAGSTLANIFSNTGQQVGNSLQNAAAARASGYVGSANALGGALQGGLGAVGNALTLYQLMNQGGGGSYFPSGSNPGA